MRKGCTNILILTNNYVVLAPPYLITVRIGKNLKFMGIDIAELVGREMQISTNKISPLVLKDVISLH